MIKDPSFETVDGEDLFELVKPTSTKNKKKQKKEEEPAKKKSKSKPKKE